MDAITYYINQTRDIPLLTADEEIELAKRIEQGDEEAKRQLIEANLRMVVKIANKYVGLGLDLMDLIQEGNLGLMKAVEKYDYRKNVRFYTYSRWWIESYIDRALHEKARIIKIPYHMSFLIHRTKRTIDELTDIGRVPSVEEIAEKLDKTPEEIEEVLKVISRYDQNNILSLEAPIKDAEGVLLRDSLEDRSEQNFNIDELYFLSDRERDILRCRFRERMTHEQLGEKYNISKATVLRHEKKIMKKLRRKRKLVLDLLGVG